MRTFPNSLLCLCLLGLAPLASAGGAACVMAKFQGQTLDYAFVYGKQHPTQAQEEAEGMLRAKGYADYYKHLDIMRAQNLSNLEHGYAIVIRSEFTDQRGRKRSAMGCGFSAKSYDDAQWDALRDAQAYFWGWKPDRDGFEVVEKVRY